MCNSNVVVENYKINASSQKITDLDLNLDVDYSSLKVNGKETGGESSKKLYVSLVNDYTQNGQSTYVGPILIYDGTDLYSYVGEPS